ncbi:hypothetical protein N7468_002641 [Penicillium chermesinum]|uniref:Uncharacterized protein n=1 Tax=Penicillium chermesinum TaxID=63820 RepID=A0A9W9TYM9_9EURO|nr:uncharacterized protein N7468_002641 [Penicillium chermesinum]KAJ5247658.1 hypothetical protein N7468_002641 [Penicillium chermesinum]
MANLFHAAKSPDTHANYAVYLCAQTCELVSDRTQSLEFGAQKKFASETFTVSGSSSWMICRIGSRQDRENCFRYTLPQAYHSLRSFSSIGLQFVYPNLPHALHSTFEYNAKGH